MKMKKTAIILVALAASCGPSAPEGPGSSNFFDLEAYFDAEAGRLGKLQGVEKIITLNGETQQQRGEWNAEEELDGFKDLKINRPAWRDQYEVDSLRGSDGQLAGLRYAARDSSLRIREVEIDMKEGGVEEIRVEKYIKNTVVYFHQELSYRPAEGYRIRRVQKVPLTKRSELEIAVRF
jgi:hypothetical protein